MKTKGVLAAGALATVLAIAGCGSGGLPGTGNGIPSSSLPSWAKALGSGVTVLPPESAAPGNNSPDAVMTGTVLAASSSHFADECKYVMPSLKSECTSAVGQMTPAEAASEVLNVKNFALGYTAIKGGEALVGTTGTFCVQANTPPCYTNARPAAILDSGESFATLWSDTVSASPAGYALIAMIEIKGSWYIDTSSTP